jgi:gamma-glutamyltranspeptidase/glutathione hydrolase
VLPDPDLANSHRLLAEHGLSYLDDGPIGQAIANADDRPALYPGTTLITQPGSWRWAIVRSHQAQVAQPTQVTDRGPQIYRMVPPSSRGSTEGEILNILSGFDLGSEPHATALFPCLEGSRLAYADRNAYLGDPRNVDVPLSGMLDPAFAPERRCLIQNTALPSWHPAGRPYPPFAGCGDAARRPQVPRVRPAPHHSSTTPTTS